MKALKGHRPDLASIRCNQKHALLISKVHFLSLHSIFRRQAQRSDSRARHWASRSENLANQRSVIGAEKLAASDLQQSIGAEAKRGSTQLT